MVSGTHAGTMGDSAHRRAAATANGAAVRLIENSFRFPHRLTGCTLVIAPRAFQRKEQRMSLVESCVSIGIISVITVASIPGLLQTREDYLLRSAAGDVATRMHSARIRAISRNVDCRLRVTSPVTYVVECQDPAWLLVESIVLPSGLTITANARPEFHRLGNVSPTATITLSSGAGRQKRVVVNNGGRIRID
jgi:Type II transport protein GspH